MGREKAYKNHSFVLGVKNDEEFLPSSSIPLLRGFVVAMVYFRP